MCKYYKKEQSPHAWSNLLMKKIHALLIYCCANPHLIEVGTIMVSYSEQVFILFLAIS